MDAKRRLPCRSNALYAKYRSRGRTARRTSDSHRPDPARRSFGPEKGAFYRPSLPSRKVLQSKFPMRRFQDSTPPDSGLMQRRSISPTS